MKTSTNTENKYINEHVAHEICKYIPIECIPAFAMTCTSTYIYCKSTSKEHNSIQTHRNSHRYKFQLSLLEHAKLAHCMRILECVQHLSQHKVPMYHCSIKIQAQHICSTNKVTIVIGRHIVINNVVYTYTPYDTVVDMLTHTAPMYSTPNMKNICIRHIEHDIDMLRKKIFSIMSHKYQYVSYKIHPVDCVSYTKKSDILQSHITQLDKAMKKYVISTLFPGTRIDDI